MAFNRDGRQLIVGGGNSDNSVHVYDVATGRMVHRIVATGNQGPGWPEVVALSPDGSRLAVGYPADPQNATAKVSVYSTRSWAKEFDVMSINEVEISSVASVPTGPGWRSAPRTARRACGRSRRESNSSPTTDPPQLWEPCRLRLTGNHC